MRTIAELLTVSWNMNHGILCRLGGVGFQLTRKVTTCSASLRHLLSKWNHSRNDWKWAAGEGPTIFSNVFRDQSDVAPLSQKGITSAGTSVAWKNQCSLLKEEGSSSQLCAQPSIRPSDKKNTNTAARLKRKEALILKKGKKVYTQPQNSKKKDTNKPAQCSTRVTLPPCFNFLSPHPFSFVVAARPQWEKRLALLRQRPPRNVIICVIEQILKSVFGEELARWPESSLSGNVAQGCGLLAVDSAGEVTRKKKETGSKECSTTTWPTMEMFLRRLATIHNTGLAAGIGAPASPKTPEWLPFFGRNGPLGRSGESKFWCKRKISRPFLGLGPHFRSKKKRQSVSWQQIIEITQWIDKTCMSFDTSSLKNVLLTWGKLWGSGWRRRRRGSPWRSGAGYFSRSSGCWGRCAGQGTSGQRRGRRRGRTGWSRKGGRRAQRERHMCNMARRWQTQWTWANVVWLIISETWNTTNGALLCSLVQVVRVVIVRVIVDGVLSVTIVVHIGHDEVLVIVVIYVAIFVVTFCNWRCTLYTPPVGDSELRWLSPKNHCKLCIKFFVRFMPQINRWFTDYHRFPCSISVRSIVVVMSQVRDATRKFAIATMRRKSFATNFHSAHCPPFSWGGAMSTALSWSQVDALSASCQNPPNSNGSTNCHDIHQFLLLWQYDCGLRLQVGPFQG